MNGWFKNAVIYRLGEGFDYSHEAIDAALAAQAFKPCGADAVRSVGWESALGRGAGLMTHGIGHAVFIRLRIDEKKISPSALQERLAEAISERGDGVMTRAERAALVESIEAELIPHTLPTPKRVDAYIDFLRRILVVDAASSSAADDLCAELRHALGSLPISRLETRVAPGRAMTEWLSGGGLPKHFEERAECDLEGESTTSPVVKVRRMSPLSSEVLQHIKLGMSVTRLAVRWDDKADLSITDQLEMKRISFLDALIDEAADTECETERDRIDANRTILVGTMRDIIDNITTAFGGLK